MACAIPLIATNVASIPEITQSFAELIPAESTDAIEAAIKNIFTNPETNQLRADAGRMHIIENFDWQKIAMLYEDLIFKTHALLKGEDTARWVLFKLDGGLDHLLIDEAQDTNPEQWSCSTPSPLMATPWRSFKATPWRGHNNHHPSLPPLPERTHTAKLRDASRSPCMAFPSHSEKLYQSGHGGAPGYISPHALSISS